MVLVYVISVKMMGYISYREIHGLFRKYLMCFFFSWKLMKQGRCDLVGRWRVPSCAYADFFPPAAASVACSQLVFENVYAVHVALLLSGKMTQAASNFARSLAIA